MTRTEIAQLAGTFVALACAIVGAVTVFPEFIAIGCVIGAAVVFWKWQGV